MLKTGYGNPFIIFCLFLELAIK